MSFDLFVESGNRRLVEQLFHHFINQVVNTKGPRGKEIEVTEQDILTQLLWYNLVRQNPSGKARPVSFSKARKGESVYRDQSPHAEPPAQTQRISEVSS